jgi:hypothetical protein
MQVNQMNVLELIEEGVFEVEVLSLRFQSFLVPYHLGHVIVKDQPLHVQIEQLEQAVLEMEVFEVTKSVETALNLRVRSNQRVPVGNVIWL